MSIPQTAPFPYNQPRSIMLTPISSVEKRVVAFPTEFSPVDKKTALKTIKNHCMGLEFRQRREGNAATEGYHARAEFFRRLDEVTNIHHCGLIVYDTYGKALFFVPDLRLEMNGVDKDLPLKVAQTLGIDDETFEQACMKVTARTYMAIISREQTDWIDNVEMVSPGTSVAMDWHIVD